MNMFLSYSVFAMNPVWIEKIENESFLETGPMVLSSLTYLKTYIKGKVYVVPCSTETQNLLLLPSL